MVSILPSSPGSPEDPHRKTPMDPTPAIEAYHTTLRHVTNELARNDLTTSTLNTLKGRLGTVFQEATTSISRFVASAPNPDERRKELTPVLSHLNDSYTQTARKIDEKITSIPPFGRTSSGRPVAFFGDANQHTLSLEPEEIITNILTAVDSKGNFVPIEELSTHFDVESYQHHSCGANALEAALIFLTNPTRTDFGSDLIRQILSSGVTQYEVIRHEIEKEKLSNDPNVRAIAEAKAGPDGITLDAISQYYDKKGLILNDLKHSTISSESAQGQIQNILERLEPNHTALINVGGRFISIACTLNEKREKQFAIFDSHSSPIPGQLEPAMLSRFASAEEIIPLIIGRLPVDRETVIQTGVFVFNPPAHNTHLAKVAANQQQFNAWATANPAALAVVLSTMRQSIAATRAKRAEEYGFLMPQPQIIGPPKTERAPRKETSSSDLKLIGNQDSQRAFIDAAIRDRSMKEELLNDFEKIKKTVEGKAFLNRLFNGLLTNSDLSSHRELLEKLAQLRLEIIIPQAHLLRKELTHTANIVASIIHFDKT